MNSEEVSGQTLDIFKSSAYSKWDILTSQRPLPIGRRHVETSYEGDATVTEYVGAIRYDNPDGCMEDGGSNGIILGWCWEDKMN